MDIPRFQIRSQEDVQSFLRFAIIDAGLGWDFHPDDDFSAFVERDSDGQLTETPLFSEEDALYLNQTLDRCFEICAKIHRDIYHLSLQIQLQLPEE